MPTQSKKQQEKPNPSPKLVSFSQSKFFKQSFKQSSANFNPLWLKVIFVIILSIIAENWQHFIKIPTNYYSWTACVFALGVYRPLNQDKISWLNNFYFSFYIRLAWGFIFAFVTTGTLIPNTNMFIVNILQALITTTIFYFISLEKLKYVWGVKLFRFLVFVFDQIIGSGFVVNGIFRQVVVKRQTLLFGLFLCIIKGICRPGMQIITGYWNKNCSQKNRNKWLMICCLNSIRHIFLLMINYLIWQGRDLDQANCLFGTLGQSLTFFNLCFGATVGYLMYTQTYTL